MSFFFFCLYWEPLGIPFPLMVVYILFLLTLYFFCNLDHEMLYNSYSPWMMGLTTLLSPSTNKAFQIGIGTSIGGGGIWATT